MSATETERSTVLRRSVRELWCEGCGYGVVVRPSPPECPMCRRESWCERPPSQRYN